MPKWFRETLAQVLNKRVNLKHSAFPLWEFRARTEYIFEMDTATAGQRQVRYLQHWSLRGESADHIFIRFLSRKYGFVGKANHLFVHSRDLFSV